MNLTCHRDKRRVVERMQQGLLPLFCLGCVLLTTTMMIPAVTALTTNSRQLHGKYSTCTNTQRWRLSSPIPPSRTQSVLCMSTRPNVNMRQPNLAVSLDQPLFPIQPSRPTTALMWKSVLAVLVSDVFKMAALAFCLAFGLSIVARFSRNHTLGWKMMVGRVSRVWDMIKLKKKEPKGVPMTFDSKDNEGWGVCSLRSKRRLGRSSFVQYDFDLPRSDNSLHLDLGQQISLCCLDNDNNVAKGDFYLYHGEQDKLGSFAIVAPNRTPEDNTYEVGQDAANFVRVMKEDLKVGDEVALKPGSRKLEYRGQYLPVTDMVYIACGVGIVPVTDQLKAVLPNGSSSVKSVSVVWVNENAKDFDVISDQLEREYFKYSTKLAVSCIVDNLRANTLADNAEVVAAIPDYTHGTMAVISGPHAVSKQARSYLIKRGYPEDCICIL